MVSSAARVEGGAQIFSAGMRKTIQSIKEIVGNHSDSDIYVTLKETNMDPNETTQKLLNQDPFHEVRRKRDKKREPQDTGFKGPADFKTRAEHLGQGTRFHTYSDRNSQRGGYTRNSLPGSCREFRVVRDNRLNQNTEIETSSGPKQSSTSGSEQATLTVSKGLTETAHIHKPMSGQAVSHERFVRDANLGGNDIKESTERQTAVPNGGPQVRSRPNDSRPSSADPVHVPSLDSRSYAAVGAIRRVVGVVGVRRQQSDNYAKQSSVLGSSAGRENSSTEPFHRFVPHSGSEQFNRSTLPEPVLPNISVSRPPLNNQYVGRSHQHPVSHQKVSQPNKEWKPKLIQKSSSNSFAMSEKSGSPPPDNSANSAKGSDTEAAKLQDMLARMSIWEDRNVIIADHIRVPENERCRLTFGSLAAEFDLSRNSVSGHEVGATAEEPAVKSFSSAAEPEASPDDMLASKQVDMHGDHIRNADSDSPASGVSDEHQLPDKEPPCPHNLENYADISMVQESQSYTLSGSREEHNSPELSSFSAYDPQTGYDVSYFRPTIDETARAHSLPLPPEILSSHTANTIMQQQQPPSASQMYPQVHVSHYANLMPYRHFLSPVYVPPMAMPAGYTSNPAYPHPSNGSNYLLMPGGASHLSANGLKYGIQQFKPVPAGSPTGFGTFTTAAGYAVNAPGVVGSATGLEDSSRLKYKDGNLYVPNPQAETSEVWIQNPRDLPGLQSASYYGMPGQSPHTSYLPPHTGHASFNAAAAAAQSSHAQFPGLYHPPPTQPANPPHHLGPMVGGTGGPGAQVGAYQQQPQLGHLNWTASF